MMKFFFSWCYQCPPGADADQCPPESDEQVRSTERMNPDKKGSMTRQLKSIDQ